MSEKNLKPIYVGYLGPTNGYTFFSHSTLTDRTIIHDTWELMTAQEDIKKFTDVIDSGDAQFVIAPPRGFGKAPSRKPSEYLDADKPRSKKPEGRSK